MFETIADPLTPDVSVLGDDVTVSDEVYCNGASVLPHKTIKANVDGESLIVYASGWSFC